MKKIKLAIVSLAALVGLTVLAPVYVGAAPVDDALSGAKSASGGDNTSLQARFEDIVNLLLFVIGAIAVIMIIVGGIKYTTSAGDSSAITSAKNTILYSVVGLVIAILAYAIVNFVLKSFA